MVPLQSQRDVFCFTQEHIRTRNQRVKLCFVNLQVSFLNLTLKSLNTQKLRRKLTTKSTTKKRGEWRIQSHWFRSHNKTTSLFYDTGLLWLCAYQYSTVQKNFVHKVHVSVSETTNSTLEQLLRRFMETFTMVWFTWKNAG